MAVHEHISETDSIPPVQTPNQTKRNRSTRWLLTVAILVIAVITLYNATVTSQQDTLFLQERFQTFVTIFLGIFIEAAPFLLIGSIVSGFIAVFVNQSMLDRYLPKNPFMAALSGSLLGFIFPVCECGVVPVTRRLYGKGLPLSIGIAFLLSAPVINPVVILSTYAAFGWGPVLAGRVIFSLLIAFIVGLLFHWAKPNETLLAPVLKAQQAAQANHHKHHHDGHHHHEHDEHHNHDEHHHEQADAPPALGPRVWSAMHTAGDDFVDMVRYLIIGSMLAAAMQTVVPQTALLAIGQGSVISVLAMQALAFVLSVCSTVDAFLALAFTSTFTTGSIVAFLTFGPMVDIKSALMFLGVFQRRVVFYLILLPFLLSLLVGILWNVMG